MTMTLQQSLLTIGIIMLGTMLTRFLPFLLFPAGRKTPDYVQFLGRALPPAVLGLLVIYCYKSTNLLSANHGIPELFSGLVVVLLQKWRKNLFLSILAGTVLYMVLIRLPLFGG